MSSTIASRHSNERRVFFPRKIISSISGSLVTDSSINCLPQMNIPTQKLCRRVCGVDCFPDQVTCNGYCRGEEAKSESFYKDVELTPTQKLRDLVKIQGADGNWDYSPYMHGMFNGLELASATIDGREVEFRDPPKRWTCKEETKFDRRVLLVLIILALLAVLVTFTGCKLAAGLSQTSPHRPMSRAEIESSNQPGRGADWSKAFPQ